MHHTHTNNHLKWIFPILNLPTTRTEPDTRTGGLLVALAVSPAPPVVSGLTLRAGLTPNSVPRALPVNPVQVDAKPVQGPTLVPVDQKVKKWGDK